LRKLLSICLSVVLLTVSTASAISIPDEQKLGKEFMAMIKDHGLILHDPVARHLINTVGHHILKTLPPQPFHFDFNLINDDSFNAFASPAANIFIHRGLFASLDTIDEFAGIMAHEIAHAVSRHVSQSIDRSKLVTIGSLAGMLAGVLLGSAGGGDAASAVTIGSMAAGQSSMLAFTRDNETEADQKAVLFLDRTGYDPKGMLDGLIKMRATDYFGMDGIPDYFKTHPGSGNRIAHIAGILADHKSPPDKPKPPKTFDFQMVKYRIIGLYGDPDKYMAALKGRLQQHPEDPALNYGIGLLYGRLRRTDLAEAHLQKALSAKLFDPMILLEIGRLNIETGNFEKALTVLSGIIDDEVLGTLATYYSAVAQIEIGDLASAEAGLTTVLEREPDGFPKANFHMAHIMSRQSNDPMSHYYLGFYHAQTRDFKNALRHLSRAVETLTDTGYKEKAGKELDKVRNEMQKTRQGG
jgi:predicted Zn-dependent protease